MRTLKRIAPRSVANLFGIMYGAIGLIPGVIMLVAGGIGAATGQGSWQAVMGVLGLIAFPLFYGIMGFLLGLLTAWLYNVIAARVGGIQMEVE